MELRVDLSGLPVADLARYVKAVVEALADASAPMMERWRLAPLYEGRIRAQVDPEHGSGVERFRLPLQTAAQGWGDCDALAVYRIAELRAQGIPATCRVDWRGPEMHARVRLPGGGIEDPWKVMEREKAR